ncbi:NAD(P)-binding domain-containing protein [Sphingomonas sp. MMS24-J13]|uniref:NAD(P)-binding domain-containing protein n=1 Tax=Sphingomonas sp. MMS24-J13 TaxID=3238686 RepID=UPI00384A4E56
MKIGIVGAGKIGGLIGTLWSRSGHDVMFASRHPESLSELVEAAGGAATTGTPDQAIAFGDVILLSIPFKELPAFGPANHLALERKVVLDTSNPTLSRDGALAEEVLGSGRGTGAYLREWLPGVRVVRAFNTVWDKVLANEAHRVEPRVGIPLASDDDEALQIASALVVDAGFDPVIVGALDRSREFDRGTEVYDTGMTGSAIREALGLSRDGPSGMSEKQQIRVSDEVQITEAARAGNTPEAADIEEPIVSYFKALNSGNLEAVLQLYTQDPVMLPFMLPTVVGTDAVRRNYENTFHTIRFNMHTTIEELVQMSPEWAFVRTDSAGIFTPIRTGQGTPSTFHELFLLQKESDGKWRIARYSFSPTAKLPDL